MLKMKALSILFLALAGGATLSFGTILSSAGNDTLTGNRSANLILNGSFEADAGADYSSFAAEFLSKDTAKGLELVSDALLHPTFPQAEVDKLLAQSVDGVKAAKDSARDVIFEYYEGYLYNGKGYGRPTGGDENSLKKIQRDAIVKRLSR